MENKNIIRSKLKKIKIKNNIIAGMVMLENLDEQIFDVNNLILKHRNRLLSKEYQFPVKVRNKNKLTYVYFNIDITEVDWKPYYWDVYVELVINDEIKLLRVKNNNKKLKLKLNFLPFSKSIYLNNKFHLFPYVTSYGSFSLTYKPFMYYESKRYQFKWLIAWLIYFILKPYWDNKKIWIGFEKNANSAQDNGFSFFQYCYEQQKHKHYYYIIKKSSPDIENLKEFEDRVIFFMSFKYMVYLLASKLLVSSETKNHVYDIRIQRGLLRRMLNNKKLVFLQHGVIGLKRVDNIYHKDNNNIDLFVTSSEYEKQIILNHFGYNSKEVEITGLSRWDKLFNNLQGRKILIMPTWRSWMDDISYEEFFKSHYYKIIKNLITSHAFLNLLSEYDLNATLFLHPKFTKYAHLFKTENHRVNVASYNHASVSQEIAESSLMITDYSSVAWDMYFLGKPIIFYQFDKEEYLEYQGSYMDFSKELFGDQVLNLNDLNKTLAFYAKNDFQEKKIYMSKKDRFFEYIDHKNNERIFHAIMNHFPHLCNQFKDKSIKIEEKNRNEFIEKAL